ncbi:hypothetical protein INS49_007362 [Diaporthe citri]|uniref:uncharacterized protein n=1 Tax=Diaporthe citri TaxID=83186 RepID=UPI001C81689B|nr:uncharacterized protein INS49_007362 [Diaporthe citri]KAG6365751.1 hypothetical protein INS49_007362 [Diaporthe citri]
MTSIASESVATILCTSKQTRFDIQTPSYRELDIDGLDITVTSGGKAGAKGKLKARTEGTEILADAKLRLKAGQRCALVGKNGLGKSTLLKAIAEELIPGIPEESRIVIMQQTDASPGGTDETLSEAVLKSEENDHHDLSVLQHVIEKATGRSDVEQEINEVEQSSTLTQQPGYEISADMFQKETQEAIKLLADLQLQIEPTNVAETESKAKRILTGLGFSETHMAKTVASLSGGWKMRTALSVALLQETGILILDEPTNFLDLLGIIWLQRYLEALDESDQAPTLILVCHDRDFITVCGNLLILKDKKLTYFVGDLPTYESSQLERKLWLTKMSEAQDKQKAHFQQLRQAKPRQKKLDERWGLEVSAKGGRFKLSRDLVGFHATRRADIDVPPDERRVNLVLPEPPDLRFPGTLISVEKAFFRYPTRVEGQRQESFVLQGINLSAHMGDRVGILGLNGAGKSTLIKLLVGESRPSSGTVTTHPRLKLGYYSQHAIDNLHAMGQGDPTLTDLSLLTREVDGALDEGQLRGLLSGLGLQGRVASDTPVTKLSGGQLVRCELARILWSRPHCLILDEVTTHLDYETVTAMREVLRDWEGALVLVSHDRWFLRGVVEGMVDDPENEEDLEEDEGETPRTRVVYKLSAGKMTLLEQVAFYVSQNPTDVTSSGCSSLCRRAQGCASFAYGVGYCLLYTVPVVDNLITNPSSPYLFNDLACVAAVEPTSLAAVGTSSAGVNISPVPTTPGGAQTCEAATVTVPGPQLPAATTTVTGPGTTVTQTLSAAQVTTTTTETPSALTRVTLVTLSGSVSTLTLPASTVTQTLPAITATSTLTLPAVTRSATLTLPAATSTLTLPAATSTVTLPAVTSRVTVSATIANTATVTIRCLGVNILCSTVT